MACNTLGCDRVLSLVSSLGIIDLGMGCAQGVAAEPISPSWQLGTGLLSLTSIASGSPCN